MAAISQDDITGLVLAGGRGSRMGGLDKGLQPFRGQPLALRALQRLAPQTGALLVNANRHTADYAAWGHAVVADAAPDFAGPLAGMLAGLQHCRTGWLVTVPCDSPLFPLDLVAQLAAAAPSGMAVVTARAASAAAPRLQPVFCLMAARLAPALAHYLAQGGRKVGEWAALQDAVQVPFGPPRDHALAFANANTLEELDALEAAAR
ncbi:molybdenum cofactor guanylyltransferase MobA [Xylophilus sp. ASV27]|uniref:molybdenum cofactor guanylyltransferase MobA n=1 Tax=Xylophilus sp. ASV27 TaxID=2795129 RepID=UPI00351C43FA